MNKLIGKFDLNGEEIIIVKRARSYDTWYCGYLKCKDKVTVDPEYPRQGYTDSGEVMLFDQPDLGLVGWYYFWDTAHYDMINSIDALLTMISIDRE